MQVKGHAKNAKMLTIPISDGGMAFLEKWKGKNENYVFGILGDEFDLGDCELLKETLNAKNIDAQNMYIDSYAALNLIKTYFSEEA